MGAKYEGGYVNDLKEGQGKYTYGNGAYTTKENGGKYEGEWVEGVKQGKGIYTFGNGDVFEGIYENNLRNGPGFKKQVDGEHREENWKEDKLVNFNVVKEKDKGK